MNISLLNQRYVPLRKLGSGGMAEVFLARQTGEAGFQREVALKKIHRRLSDHPRAVRMFLEEAKLAAGLCHPNIVQIYDVGREEKNFIIVMEHIDGVDLRTMAERTTALGQMIPLDISLTIIGQVLEGLMYAHNYHDDADRPMAIVHGDIGPNNILVSFQGGVKLVDFGIARAEDQIRQEGAVHAGKISYMSPEAIRGLPQDARSDLFSAGILLYELTVGQRLFRVSSSDSMKRVLDEPIAPPTYTRSSYPADLEIIVMRALELEPGDRYGTAEEMLEELENFAFNYSQRLSRLRLGRYTRELMGISHSESLEDKTDQSPELQPLELADDLDFDHEGNFDEDQEPEVELLVRKSTPQQQESRRVSPVMAAMQQADAAIAELEAASRNQEIARREPSTVVVTEDLVEEEFDADDPVLELDTPKKRTFLDDSLDAELDADLADEDEDEPLPDEQSAIHEPVPAGDSQDTRADSPVARRRAQGENVSDDGDSIPSADLLAALADISVELGVASAATAAPDKPAAPAEFDDVIHDITIDLDLDDLELDEEELGPDDVVDLDQPLHTPPPLPPPDEQEPEAHSTPSPAGATVPGIADRSPLPASRRMTGNKKYRRSSVRPRRGRRRDQRRQRRTGRPLSRSAGNAITRGRRPVHGARAGRASTARTRKF